MAFGVTTGAATRGRSFFDGTRVDILRVVPVAFSIETGAYLRVSRLLVERYVI